MRSPTKLCLGLSVLLALGTGTLGLSPAAASASQPTPSAKTLSPGLTSALQRDLGLTASQARTRLIQEAAATKLAPRAERAAGQTFGGSWYDAAHGTLVVGLTDTGGAAADSVRSTGATVVRVAHSARALDATKRHSTPSPRRTAPPRPSRAGTSTRAPAGSWRRSAREPNTAPP